MQTITTSAATKTCDMCNGLGYVSYAVRYHTELAPDRSRVTVEDERVIVPYDWGDGQFYATYPAILETLNEAGDVVKREPGYVREMGYCVCKEREMKQRKLEKLLQRDDIPDSISQFTFEDFAAVPHAQGALDYIRQLADGRVLDRDSGTEKTGILIIGPTGTFKSTLAGLVYLEHLGASCWLNFNTFLTRIRATYEKGYEGESVDTMVDVIKGAEFLLLDDFGSMTRDGKLFEDAIEAARKIFEYRLNKHLATIVTTNLGIDQLYNQFGDRAISRLRGLCAAVTMHAPDARAPMDARKGTK